MSLLFKQYLENMCTMFKRIYYYVIYFFSPLRNVCYTLKCVSTANSLACALTASVLMTGNNIYPNYAVCDKLAQIMEILIRLVFQVLLSDS